MKIVFSSIALLAALAGHSQKSLTVYFDFDHYDLTKKARLQLDSFLNTETKSPGDTLFILDGYCDPFGSDEYNQRLSLNRVSTVKKYLLQNGISKANIARAAGHGEKDPLNENRTEDDRQLNRRVKIMVGQKETGKENSDKTITQKIADSTVMIGSNIILRNINFAGGMHHLLPESEPMLDELLDAMTTYPNLVIRIEGHICCQEGPADGLDIETDLRNLSDARAKAIKDYLIAKGIEAARISHTGFGHSAPIYPYPEQTEEERKLNRRVEIKIIRK